MNSIFTLSALLLLGSCGALMSLNHLEENRKERLLASVALKNRLSSDDQTFELELEEKLNALHAYSLISQKELYRFEEEMKEKKLSLLYQSLPYLNLLAAKTQIDEIEFDLIEAWQKLSPKKKIIFGKKVKSFTKNSIARRLSLENLASILDIGSVEESGDLSLSELKKEYQELEKSIEFQIFEKNIDHLSHILETNLPEEEKRPKPDEGHLGTVSGQEFPSKVWSLTFSNGPTGEVTHKILDELKKRKLKATFFQLQSRLSHERGSGLKLINEGMEMAAQGITPKELAKAGMLTLEKEISDSTKTMEKNLKIDIKFYRLPYGSGIDVPVVREVLAKNNLINAFWNVDSLDWIPQSPDRIVKRTRDLMRKTPRDGGMILFHDVHQRSVSASARIMDVLKSDSRRVCTLGEIVSDLNEGKGQVCSSSFF